MKRVAAVLASLALVPVLLGAGLMMRARAITRDLGARLVADTRALEENVHARPSHVDAPDPRSFGDLLEPHVDGLRAARLIDVGFTEADKASRRAVNEKGEPVSSLTPTARKWVETGRSGSAGARAATHGLTARHPEGMRSVSDPDHPGQDDGMAILQTAAKISAIVIRERLEARDATGAVAVCLDGLAIGREATHEMALLGAMVGAAIDGLLFESCAAALDAAPVATKRDAAARIRRVIAGHAPMSESLQQEAVVGDLTVFATTMNAKQREELSPEAQRMIGTAAASDVLDRISVHFQHEMLRAAWPESRRMREEMSAAMELPRAERNARLHALSRRAENAWNPITRIGFPDYSKFEDRRRSAMATLKLLARAAEADATRAETGAWLATESPTGDEPPGSVVLSSGGVLVVRLPRDARSIAAAEATARGAVHRGPPLTLACEVLE